MITRSKNQIHIVLAVSLLLLVIVPTANVHAATLCFAQTGQCIGEPFGEFWNRNGGLPIFGFPQAAMAPAFNPDTSQTHLAQWFERQRLEFHPRNQQPYTVLLGRLGAEQLHRLGRDWTTLPKADKHTPHYFAATGQAIAPQFWTYWRAHGLDLGDPGVSEREALALFGYPLSPAAMERNQAGAMVLTQWFERARFEYHPTDAASGGQGAQVLLGLLGTEAMPSKPPTSPPSYEDRTGVMQMLQTYYNAINRKEYQRAYGYWEFPGTSPALTPPDYATFVDGYAETAYVAVTTGEPLIDAGAGNVWASIAVVLRATTNDGGTQMFAGCYVLHRTNEGSDPRADAALWKLNRTRIDAHSPTTTPAALLPTLQCAPGDVPPDDVQPQVVTLRVADAEQYRIRLHDATDIAIAHKLFAGMEAPTIPHGRVVRGDPDVNFGYSWHIDPSSIEFVDATIEVCDGRPSDVEQGIITSSYYCPWSANVMDIQPLVSTP